MNFRSNPLLFASSPSERFYLASHMVDVFHIKLIMDGLVSLLQDEWKDTELYSVIHHFAALPPAIIVERRMLDAEGYRDRRFKERMRARESFCD